MKEPLRRPHIQPPERGPKVDPKERLEERARAVQIDSIKKTPGGRLLIEMMEAKIELIRGDFFLHAEVSDVGRVGQSKGAENELQQWISLLKEEIQPEEKPRETP